MQCNGCPTGFPSSLHRRLDDTRLQWMALDVLKHFYFFFGFFLEFYLDLGSESDQSKSVSSANDHCKNTCIRLSKLSSRGDVQRQRVLHFRV